MEKVIGATGGGYSGNVHLITALGTIASPG